MHRLLGLSVRAKMFLLIGVFMVGLAGFLGVVFTSLDPRLERSDYRDVVQLKDVVADVLPPPLYMVEPYLVLHEMRDRPDEVAALEERWRGFQRDYQTRHDVWREQLKDQPLRDLLTRQLDDSARAFFAVADRDFLPAARAGDREAMTRLLAGSLRQAYDTQRADVDAVVAEANRRSQLEIAAAATRIEDRKLTLLAMGLGIITIGFALGFAITRSITRRVQGTVDALRQVAAGDFTGELHDDARDELGEMARALNVAVGAIRTALGEVQEVASGLTSVSGELEDTARTIASGAREQAASLEESAASLEQITATVRSSADHAREASDLAVGSQQAAEHGGEVVGQAVGAMDEINDASMRISQIITTIDEIAFETNILALNATIEAARAGEHGRGFAVVAQQVSVLSKRSAVAANEIKKLISDSVGKVTGGADLVNRSGKSLGQIVSAARQVTDLVGNMATAFREQSQGLAQVSQAIAEMDVVTQQNSAQTEQLSSSATTLADHAERMRELVSAFRIQREQHHIEVVNAAAAKAAKAEPARPAAMAPVARRDRRTAPHLET